MIVTLIYFRCTNKTYNLSVLSPTSVILSFHRYEKLVHLLHTIHSIVQRTPVQLLREIILIDDDSRLGRRN